MPIRYFCFKTCFLKKNGGNISNKSVSYLKIYTIGPSMWKKPNLSLLNFFLVFFSSSNLDIFFWKNKPNFQICLFFISEKKNQIWIWSFSLMNLDFFWRKKKNKFKFVFFLKKKIQIWRRKKNQEKNLVNSNLVFFTWTDLLYEKYCSKDHLTTKHPVVI